VSITRARRGLREEQDTRRRRYLAAMLVRTGCVLVMAACWERWPVLAGGALIGGVVIPFLAVVGAQGGWQRGRGVRPQLAPAAEEPCARAPLEATVILPAPRSTP
jgi:hypothetical protein